MGGARGLAAARRALPAALAVGASILGGAAPARADRPPPPPPPPAAYAPAEAPPWAPEPLVARREPAFADPYRMAMAVPENRAAVLAAAVPATPFLLTQGEAATPCCGYASLTWQRLSDERVLEDRFGNVYTSDGEVQVLTAEWVSRGLWLELGRRRLRAHVGVSLQAFTLHEAIYDGLRNWVEENLLAGDPPSLGHFVGGRALEVMRPSGETIEILDGSPTFKAKLVGKLHLPSLRLGRTHLEHAVSLGVGSPTFGSRDRSGNDGLQPDLAWAFAVPAGRHLRVTGAATLQVPGSSPLFRELGIAHRDLVFAAHANLEWWFTPCVAFAAGVSYHTSYLTGSGLPMDLDSTYVNLGILWRVTSRATVFVLFSENTDAQINTLPGSDYSRSQKESDFNLSFGLRWTI